MFDRSDSPLAVIPLVDLSWVDPRVVEFSSTYDTEASMTKFLAKYPVLKAGEDFDDSRDPNYFRILPCGSTERVCMGRAGVGPPFFTCIPVFFQIFMCPSLSISSQWASFGRSMWLPPKCIQIRGRPFRRFACCVMPCGFAPPLLLFFAAMALIPIALPLGSLWSVGQGTFCSTLLRSRTRGLRKGSSRSSFGPRRQPFSLTEPVGLGSPCIGPPNPKILSCDRGRR